MCVITRVTRSTMRVNLKKLTVHTTGKFHTSFETIGRQFSMIKTTSVWVLPAAVPFFSFSPFFFFFRTPAIVRTHFTADSRNIFRAIDSARPNGRAWEGQSERDKMSKNERASVIRLLPILRIPGALHYRYRPAERSRCVHTLYIGAESKTAPGNNKIQISAALFARRIILMSRINFARARARWKSTNAIKPRTLLTPGHANIRVNTSVKRA